MTAIGALKGTRTRAKSSLEKAVAGVRDILNNRANVRGMSQAQLDDLLHGIDTKIKDVRMKMERLELANDKLAQAYAEDDASQADFQTILDGESNLMDGISTATNEMEALKTIIEWRLAQAERPGPKVEERQGGFEDQVTQILARLTVQAAAAPVAAPPEVAVGGAAGGSTLKLPKLEIDKFDYLYFEVARILGFILSCCTQQRKITEYREIHSSQIEVIW